MINNMNDDLSDLEEVTPTIRRNVDPLGRLGYGILSYFKYLTLSAGLLILAVIAIRPVLLDYSSTKYRE